MLWSEQYLFVAVRDVFIYMNTYDSYFLPSPSPAPQQLYFYYKLLYLLLVIKHYQLDI